MARGTWEDFTDKYGFGDGGQLESRDFVARAVLVKKLNEQPELITAGIRALKYDRPGVRNRCIILLARAVEGKSDEELLEAWTGSSAPELPELDADLDELIDEAYDDAEDVL